MKVSKNFSLAEFVPPDVLEQYPASGIWFIDQRIINIAQFIRDRYNLPVTINNYLTGGNYVNSGFRHPNSQVGAELSQHKQGRAIDIKVDGMFPEEVRQDIIRSWPLYRTVGVTTIETNTPTWTHIDCRYTGLDTLFIVKP